MTTFDYNSYPVVGALNIIERSGNGYIKVYGYLDGHKFISFSKYEAENIFTPDGEVFAANIKRYHSDKNGSLVSLYVMPNTKEGGKNSYVWDWNGEVEIAGTRIIQLKDFFDENGQSNYDILKENDLIDVNETMYALSEDKLFYIKPHSESRLLPFCKLNDTLPVIGDNNRLFLYGFSIPTIDGSIDITTDEQLVDWFLRTIKVEWDDIQKGSGKVSLRAAKEALLSSKNLPENIVRSRIRRLTELTDTYVFTRDNLKDIASASWLKPSLEAAINKYKEDYIDSILEEQHEELERIQTKHQEVIDEENDKFETFVEELRLNKEKIETDTNEQIASINQELARAKEELEDTQSKIESNKKTFEGLESGIARLEKRKGDIVEDFQIVREVLNHSVDTNCSHLAVASNSLCYESVSERELPQLYKAYEKNLETCMRRIYQLEGGSIAEVAELHAAYKVLLLPSIQMAKAMISAAGRSWSAVVYVSVAWRSFDDLWKAGLQTIVEHCASEPDTIHYLVVRNINLTCLTNYLQPLADLQGGYIKTFPNTDLELPNNLRILLTISDEELLPMSENILKFFGCVTRDITTNFCGSVQIPSDALLGYLDTKLLKEASEHISQVNNNFKDYVDE